MQHNKSLMVGGGEGGRPNNWTITNLTMPLIQSEVISIPAYSLKAKG